MDQKYSDILFKQAQDMAVLKFKMDLAATIAEQVGELVKQNKLSEAAQLAWVLAKVTDA
jgi:ribosomal protein L32E